MNDMFKRDLPKRLNDPAIRKIFFITTDGLPTSCTSNIQPYLKIPVTIFAIGSRSKVEWGNLVEMARGDPDHAKKYADFPQFLAELPSLLDETCQIGSHVVPVGKPPAGGTRPSSDNKFDFDISGMMPGDTRYFNLNITEGDTASIKVSPKKINIKMYASFSNKYPSEVSYDFKAECNAGSQCNLVVKHPAQFANAVCVQNSKGTKEYTVAIIATGGTGPEDLTAVNNVGSNIGGDYSSAENNDTSKPSKKQVIVQARMGVASRLLVSDFLLIVRFILITYGYVG